MKLGVVVIPATTLLTPDELRAVEEYLSRRQRKVLAGSGPPNVETGEHCASPYECPFISRCWAPAPDHHISTLYNLRRKRAGQDTRTCTNIQRRQR